MRYTRYILPCILAVNLVAANLLPRDYTQLKKDLVLVDSDQNALTAAVNDFDGTAVKFAAVQKGVNKLDKDVKTTTTDFTNQASLTSNQCDYLLNYLLTIEGDVSKTSKAIIAKKQTFIPAGYKDQVVGALRMLQSDYSTMMGAVCAKCNTSTCSSIAQFIYDDWDGAIVEYTTCAKCVSCSKC